jgi:predicted nucleotidyltransferase
MNDIVKMVEGIFPGTTILLVYYSGSIAYGLNNEFSDKDITVVLDNFKGNMQLDLGEYDFKGKVYPKTTI